MKATCKYHDSWGTDSCKCSCRHSSYTAVTALVDAAPLETAFVDATSTASIPNLSEAFVSKRSSQQATDLQRQRGTKGD